MRAGNRIKRSIVTGVFALGLGGALGVPTVLSATASPAAAATTSPSCSWTGYWTFVAKPKPGHWYWTWEYVCTPGYTV